MSEGSRFTERYHIESISYENAFEFLKRHHYLSQKGNGFLGKEEHGLFDESLHLVGVIVWGGWRRGKPSSVRLKDMKEIQIKAAFGN